MVSAELVEPQQLSTSQSSTSGPDTTAQHRFPKPRFPAVISAVPALLLAVTLIAAAALALLQSPAIPEVPDTTSTELQATATRAAEQFTAPADDLVQSAELERDALLADKSSALRRIARANDDVDGLALIDRASRTVVRDRGDDVPIPPALPLPADGPQAALADDQLTVAVPVSPDRILLGSLSLRAPRLPDAPPEQRVLLVRSDGSIAGESGGRPDVPISAVHAVAAGVARGEAGFAVDDSQLIPHTETNVLPISDDASRTATKVAAVGGVPAHGTAATSGLAVMVARNVALVPGATAGPGSTAAVIVATGGVLAFLLLRVLFVRPIRRLRDDVDELVTAADTGRDQAGPIRRSRLRQADRVARFVPRPGLSAAPSRATIGGLGLVAVTGAVLIAALAAGFAAVGTHQAAQSDALIERSRATVEETSATLERTLTQALAAVQISASPTVGETKFDWPSAVQQLHLTRPAFRSVYVRDAGGNIVASAGESPRSETTPTSSLSQMNDSGPEPVVTAAAPTHDGQFTVIAEFDPHTLNAALRGSGPATEVFDGEARTILGSAGYVAFSELNQDDEDPLRRAVTEATVAPGAGIENFGDAQELVAAQRMGRSAATAELGWVVLQHRDVTTARYTVDPIGRAVTVIVGVTGLACLGLLAWCYVTTIQPLRRYGDWLERRAGSSGPPPRRLDEVGAVMAGLNHYVKQGGRP